MSISVSRSPAWVGLYLLLFGCHHDSDSELIAQLQSPSADSRRAAARSLGEQPVFEPRFVDALTTAVTDQDAEVRRLSIGALGKFGPAAQSSLPALTAALQDPELGVRLKAALAIPKIDRKNSSFVPVLVGAMRAGDGRIFLEVGAMGEAGAWAVPTLVALLSHESAKVRALAAQTLGRIGLVTPEAKAALQRCLRDPNAAVQTAAKDALDRLQPQNAGTA
jgi:HEAT repeat protein